MQWMHTTAPEQFVISSTASQYPYWYEKENK
jgi:hypothetical protein